MPYAAFMPKKGNPDWPVIVTVYYNWGVPVLWLRACPPMELFFGGPFPKSAFKAYFGYFRYVQVPSDPYRWRYFWDKNGRGHADPWSFWDFWNGLQNMSHRVQCSPTYGVGMDKLSRAFFRVVAEFVFFGTDLTPEIAICSKIFHDKNWKCQSCPTGGMILVSESEKSGQNSNMSNK